MKGLHEYKGFNLVKNGTKEYPWNIYKIDGHGFGEHVGFDRTLKACKQAIDSGCFEMYELMCN